MRADAEITPAREDGDSDVRFSPHSDAPSSTSGAGYPAGSRPFKAALRYFTCGVSTTRIMLKFVWFRK